MPTENSPTCTSMPAILNTAFLNACTQFVNTINRGIWNALMLTQQPKEDTTANKVVLNISSQTAEHNQDMGDTLSPLGVTAVSINEDIANICSNIQETEESSNPQAILERIAKNGNIPTKEDWDFFVKAYHEGQERITRDQIATTKKPAIAMSEIKEAIAHAVSDRAQTVYTLLRKHPLKNEDGSIKNLEDIQNEYPEALRFLSYGVQSGNIDARDFPKFLHKLHSTDKNYLLYGNTPQEIVDRELHNLVTDEKYQIGQSIEIPVS